MADETKTAAPMQQRSLVRKLAEVMAEVGRIPKSGYNDFHKYNYATEADIVESVRAGMAARSLMLLPDVVKTEWRERGLDKNGKPLRVCSLTVRFTIEDGESGETRQLCVMGEGDGSDDKATYKAMTGATKYVLLKLFLIPTGDDPERDSPEDKGPKQRAAPAPKPAPKPAPVEPPPPAEQPKPAAVSTFSGPTPYARLMVTMTERGVLIADWGPKLKERGKTKPSQVTDEDADAVIAMFPAPPPPTDADAPGGAA